MSTKKPLPKYLGWIAGAIIIAVIVAFVWAFRAIGFKEHESEWPTQGQCEGISKSLEKISINDLTPDQHRIMERCIEHGYVLRKEAERR
jgi:hypothetical protein